MSHHVLICLALTSFISAKLRCELQLRIKRLRVSLVLHYLLETSHLASLRSENSLECLNVNYISLARLI